MSIISLLQEYCQKEKLPLPIYTMKTYTGGPPHKPLHMVNLIFGNRQSSVDTTNVKHGKEVLAQALFDSLLQAEKDNIIVPSPSCPIELPQQGLQSNKVTDSRKTLDENIKIINEKLDSYNKVMFVDYE